MSKQPTAVCGWCKGNYDPKDFFCLVHQAIIHEPYKPRRCVHYTGVKVTEGNLAYLENMVRQADRVS